MKRDQRLCVGEAGAHRDGSGGVAVTGSSRQGDLSWPESAVMGSGPDGACSRPAVPSFLTL